MSGNALCETVIEGPDTITFVYRRAREPGRREPGLLRIAVVNIREALDMLEISGDERASLLDRNRFWFVNGYQSFSPGWELGERERHPNVRIIKSLERYTLPDCARPRHGEIAAYGLAYVRAGETYLAFVSRGTGKSAPAAFLIDRARNLLTIGLLSNGLDDEESGPLARITLFKRTGYFQFADSLAAMFGESSCMRRADFLKAKGDRFLMAGGWESWYNHYTRIDERIIQEDLEGLDASPNLIRQYFQREGRAVIFQIDDGWQRSVGEWEPNPDRFPSGMRPLAEAVSAKGYIPGLWLAPFLVSPGARIFREKPDWLLRTDAGTPVKAGWNPVWKCVFYCLDLSIPEVRGYLAGLFDTIINTWGFRYLKLDFLYAGALNGMHSRGGQASHWYREALKPIVSMESTRRGEPVVFLGCGAPLEISIPLFPLMRIGADTKEVWDPLSSRLIGHMGRPSAYINLKDTIGRAFMNRALYFNDPDVVFMRRSNCSLGTNEKETIAAVAMMFSSQIMISDDVGRFGGPGEEELTARTLALFKALEGREYGALMLEKDLWRCFSRDNEVRGVINLRRSAARISAKDALAWKLSGEKILDHARRDRGGLTVSPRSAALWR